MFILYKMDKVLQWRALPSTIQMCKDLTNVLDVNVGDSIDTNENNEIWIYVTPNREKDIGDAEAIIRKSLNAFFDSKIPNNVKIVICKWLHD
jgi:hypothetical protein